MSRMATERALIVLMVGLLSTFFVDAKPRSGEEELDGPGGLRAFVGQVGGGIRQYREMPAGHDGKGPRKTGEIEIRIGKIREANETDGSRPPPMGGPPGGGPPGRGPRGPKPELENPDDITFNVEDRPYVFTP